MSKKKQTKPPVLSTSRDIVPVGPRHVQVKYRGKRDENGLRPSTSRALVLRNGKYGAQGTGEIVLAGRISGREKLDLLAEDLVAQKSRTAVMAPLKLEKCIRIADSQFNAYLDDIADLKDPESFCDKVKAEIAARTPYSSTRSALENLQDTSYVASSIATKVHNAYMMASGWKIVLDILRSLACSGLNDATAHVQLRNDGTLRAKYLALCDMVEVLIHLGQTQFSVLATTTPHYIRYFKAVENVQPGDPEIAFDWAGLKDACKSFLDSVVIELCFPKAPYPKRILYQILHDAVDESPREAKRFPQKMWDAIGELSVTLELQELLESPLLGPGGEKLKALPHQMPDQYELWLDAQILSRRASELYANLKEFVSPLEKTRDRSVLDNMWGVIDLNYRNASNLPIDALWQLDDALRRTPQWSAFYVPTFNTYNSSSEDEGLSRSLVKSSRGKKNGAKVPQKKLLAITDGRADDEDDDDSMPELQSVSDSSEESDDEIFDSDDDDSDDDEGDSDYDNESDYDSEEEEQYRAMLRDAMDTAMAIPEFFDPKTAVPEFEQKVEERKGNPFLKILSSLRGRMFSSDAKLSSTSRTEPQRGFPSGKVQAAKTAKKAAPASHLKIDFSGTAQDDLPPLPPLSTPRRRRVLAPAPTESPVAPVAPPTIPQPKDHRTTIEEVEDEDAPSMTGKKKKRKKPKKKKTGQGDLQTIHEDGITVVPAASSRTAQSPSELHQNKASFPNNSFTTLPDMSTNSLPIESTTGKSGHSYLQELGPQKEKIKSRPDHGSLFGEKRGFLTKLSGKDKIKEKDKVKANETDPNVNKKFGWFCKLSKKATSCMHQLLRTSANEKQGSMKWENFVKLMREMGFSYDPSTAGSSVRFDPPNKNDRSITFHKPHPNPTLEPNLLRDFGKKLKEYYGWSEEDFLKRIEA